MVQVVAGDDSSDEMIIPLASRTCAGARGFFDFCDIFLALSLIFYFFFFACTIFWSGWRVSLPSTLLLAHPRGEKYVYM